MNVQLLIHTLVRQTMVLIAQVATTSGVRTPLAPVANQVFLDLVGELERQGVGRKVVADMFGLALRSYQQKVQRLSESATDSGVTLWQAIHSYLKDKEVATRAEVLTRFSRDDQASVKSILKDLVETGMVYQAGPAERCVYRVAPEEDWRRLSRSSPEDLASVVWLSVYRNQPVTREALLELVPATETELDACLAELVEDARIQPITGKPSEGGTDGEEDTEPHPVKYSSEHCLIPLGSDAGWEAALLDHHQALVGSICAKLRNAKTQAQPADRLGGSTYSFNVWSGHPAEKRAYELLSEVRKQLGEFWQEVTDYNDEHPAPAEGVAEVTFYCGQSVKDNHE